MREFRRLTSLACCASAIALAEPVDAQGAASGATPSLPGDSTGVVTFRVRPDTVTVGEPFALQLRMVPPVGRRAQSPAVPDTGGVVEPLDPPVVTRRGDTLFVRYRLIAWQPGVLTIPIGPVIMRRGESELAVAVDARIVVRSVLPADSADRVPRSARELFASSRPWWQRWLPWVLGVIGLTILAAVLARMWRARRRRRAVAARTPLEHAEAAFSRLDARQLTSAGEGARQIALSGEIVRRFLSETDPSLALALTSAEVLRAAALASGVPEVQLARILAHVDAVRFGGGLATRPMVDQVTALARDFVRDVARLRADTLRRAA